MERKKYIQLSHREIAEIAYSIGVLAGMGITPVLPEFLKRNKKVDLNKVGRIARLAGHPVYLRNGQWYEKLNVKKNGKRKI